MCLPERRKWRLHKYLDTQLLGEVTKLLWLSHCHQAQTDVQSWRVDEPTYETLNWHAKDDT